MSGYTGKTEEDRINFRGNSTDAFDISSSDSAIPQQAGLVFQNFDQQYGETYTPSSNNDFLDPNNSRASFMASPPQYYGETMFVNPRRLSFTSVGDEDECFDDEPPLLEELGIDPKRIMLKTYSVLNPFQYEGPSNDINFLLGDSDLAGPLMFCVALGSCLFFSGKSHFGIVYGLALTCCILMYILLNLMSNTASSVTLISVTSILGYCILPIVGLTAIGVVFSLRTPVGMAISLLAVIWCSVSSSKLFSIILTVPDQRLLIAYPCALLYGAFAIIAIF